VAKTAKVLAKAILPLTARPAAVDIMLASAMPISKNRSGIASWNRTDIVDLHRSASKATIRLSALPSSTSVSP
jgi:hypothetical protein